MSDMLDRAREFFEECETGKGWAVCQKHCHPGATFSAQADALAEITTLEGYVEWAKALLTPIPDGHYDLKGFAIDEERRCVIAAAVFKGTQTGPGGPVEPTGKSVATEYVYIMQFENGRISHMTKVWNDAIGLRQLGWA